MNENIYDELEKKTKTKEKAVISILFLYDKKIISSISNIKTNGNHIIYVNKKGKKGKKEVYNITDISKIYYFIIDDYVIIEYDKTKKEGYIVDIEDKTVTINTKKSDDIDTLISYDSIKKIQKPNLVSNYDGTNVENENTDLFVKNPNLNIKDTDTDNAHTDKYNIIEKDIQIKEIEEIDGGKRRTKKTAKKANKKTAKKQKKSAKKTKRHR